MVRMLDQLEKLSLVQRVASTKDRRVMVPTLTAAGRELIIRATPKVEASEETFAAALSPAQRAQLFDLLHRLNGENGASRLR
jgi:DNA-binding MarR family transcriptional regulator